MKMPLRERIRCFVYDMARRMFGHKYDCCPRVTKRCKKCESALRRVVKWNG